MAERVFPNNINVDMGSPIQFSGINWDEVSDSMKNNRFADDKSQAVLDLLKASGFDLDPEQEEEIEQIVEHMIGGKAEGMPGEDHDDLHDMHEHEEDEEKGHSESKFPEGFSDEDEEGGDKGINTHEFKIEGNSGGGLMGDGELGGHKAPWKLSGADNKMRKIAFTHPSQISAEAIEEAQSKGDTKLVNTILAARKENRLRIASAIQKQVEAAKKEQNTRTASVNKSEDAFVSPDKFSKAQRESFKKIAISLGMPQQYVDEMCGIDPVSEKVAKLNNQVKEVYASNMSGDTKATLIKNLVKEAKLSADSKSEFVNYWNNILGYQDKEFWPEVAADYNDGKKVK